MNPTGLYRQLYDSILHRISIDRRGLAVFRILLGVFLIIDVARRLSDFTAFYTDAGVLPRFLLQGLYPNWSQFSLLTISGSAMMQMGVFIATVIVGIALIVGFKTRLMALTSLILLISIQVRNPLILNAGDTLFRRLLFWGLLVPMGSRWAIDSVDNSSDAVANFATGGLLLQILFVYGSNAIIKLRGEHWLQGNAVRYVFQLDHLTIAIGDLVSGWTSLLVLINWLWLAMLVVSPFLIILTGRRRIALISVFIAAHFGMVLTLRLGIFPFICIIGLLPFLPPSVWDWLEKQIPSSVPSMFSHHLTNPFDSMIPSLPYLLNVLAAFAIIILLLVNGISLGVIDAPTTPDRIESRSWDMFAPAPGQQTWWYAAPATLESGTRIDAFTQKPVNLSRPSDASNRFPNERWKKFFGNARHDSRVREALANYLCNHWNQDRNNEIEHLELILLTEETQFNNTESVKGKTLGTYQCS